MGTQLSELSGTPVAVADIQRFGDKLILPAGMEIPVAVELLLRRYEYEQEVIKVTDDFKCYPWDGALALARVLERKFGWAPHKGQSRTVPIGPNGQVASVPWGEFDIPTIRAKLVLSASPDNKGIWHFTVSVTLLRGQEPVARTIFREVREELIARSIYRGKAIRLDFSDGDEMPAPEFVDTAKIRSDLLVYSKDVMDSVETNLFTPIRRIRELRANNLPIKRGVLLGGTYGTGKTLAAGVASKIAVAEGVTFLYVTHAADLGRAVEFAKQYQDPGCVIFCEDIDRAFEGRRDAQMDSLLNIIDGVDTKESNIIIVLTTNNLAGIDKAMLRPGRLDAVIEVTPPDAEAVERLIRLYGAELINPEEGLERIGKALAGHIPATIAEVVKRAKLSQLKLNQVGEVVTYLSEDALLDAVISMRVQLKALADEKAVEPDTLATAMASVVRDVMLNGGGKAVAEQVAERIGA